MKNNLSIIAMAVAGIVLASCSNSEKLTEIEQEQTPIGFNAWAGKITRNAGEMSNKAALEKDDNTMEVWGWKATTTPAATTNVFNGVTVTYNSSATTTTTKWGYSPLRYWDMEASYEFYAAAPHDKMELNDTLRLFSTTGVPKIQILQDLNGTSKVTAETTNAIDYLVADIVKKESPKGNASDGDVEFTFNHILSKLEIKAKTSDDFNNAKGAYPHIEVTEISIKLKGMCPNYSQKTIGTLTALATDGDKWDGTEAEEFTQTCLSVVGTTLEDFLLTNAAKDVASYLVAPTATGSTTADPEVEAKTYTYTATIKYDVYSGPSETDKESFVRNNVQIPDINSFVQNNAYTVIINIEPQAIYFDVEQIEGFNEIAEVPLDIDEYDSSN